MNDLDRAHLIVYSMVAGALAAGLVITAMVAGDPTWAAWALVPALAGVACSVALLVDGRRGGER